MNKIQIPVDQEFVIEEKLPLIRNALINSKTVVINYDNFIFFLIYVDNQKYMKLCLNKYNFNLEYFETYITYVDFKNIEQIILKIMNKIKAEDFKSEPLDKNMVKDFNLECPGLILKKEDLTYCFSEDKYNYIDGVKQVKFYSDYKNPTINYPNAELLLILMKYGNKYEYCIMDYNLDKVAKYVLEKNRLTSQFRLIRNEFYQDWSKNFSFEQFNNDFKQLANNNNKEEHLMDPDAPNRHGTCGFHFYHFFTIGNYFDDIKA